MLQVVPDCSGNTFVPLPEHIGCLVRVDCTASAFVPGNAPPPPTLPPPLHP